MNPEAALPVEETFDALYGLEIIERGPDLMRARVAVRNQIKQPFGLVHGGVYAAMAEALASLGTHDGVHADGMVVMGLSNQASFLRPITTGYVNAVAVPRHKGRSTWIWEVEVSDDEDRLCALIRMTIAVRTR